MAKWVINDTTLAGIADAIREKLGETVDYPVSSLAEKIASISGGGGVEVHEYIPTTSHAANNSDPVSFDNPKGTALNIFVCWADVRSSENYSFCECFYNKTFDTYHLYRLAGTNPTALAGANITITADSVTLSGSYASYFVAGNTYHYLIL